jgi:hypothetical protein
LRSLTSSKAPLVMVLSHHAHCAPIQPADAGDLSMRSSGMETRERPN